MNKLEITICLGSSCYTRGNNEVIKTIQRFIIENKIENLVNFKGELCSCNCKSGPNLKIGETTHRNINAASAIAIINDTIQLKSL